MVNEWKWVLQSISIVISTKIRKEFRPEELWKTILEEFQLQTPKQLSFGDVCQFCSTSHRISQSSTGSTRNQLTPPERTDPCNPNSEKRSSSRISASKPSIIWFGNEISKLSSRKIAQLFPGNAVCRLRSWRDGRRSTSSKEWHFSSAAAITIMALLRRSSRWQNYPQRDERLARVTLNWN